LSSLGCEATTHKTGPVRTEVAHTSAHIDPYVLKDSILTDKDFEKMDWHDVQIHAIAMANEFPRLVELLLDLDYIIQWVDPRPPEEYHNFWLAPATLVFENVSELNIRLQTEQLECQIDEMKRDARMTPSGVLIWQWTLSLHQGELSFWSTGYKQYFRQRPIFHKKQHLSLDERGGISFGRDLMPAADDSSHSSTHTTRQEESRV